ncbi:MAG TPA: sigma-70 family RNA polymerase sigma factor [Verrucomicrobiae bacterium]|nr:sigma-70 family RNA polymerase sigma factor [Verrucomicrobiae bacterium]
MKVTDSQELLADYVTRGSESAFRELVERYVDLVYSTALRCVQGDTHRAEDVAQTVFLDLARLASRFSKEILLGGWLHRHTCYVASTLLRGERRRQARERQAAEMSALDKEPDSGLSQLAPMLDAAINELDEDDRKAILLRFYERLDLRSVGQALGSSENAAQKRVSRALEQLHSILVHRGVTLSAAALAAMLAGEVVTAAPTGLAASIVGNALAGAATGIGVSVTLFQLSTLTKLKLAFAAALALGSAGTTLWLQHQAHVRLVEENESLRQQLAAATQPSPTAEPPPALVEHTAAQPVRRLFAATSQLSQAAPITDSEVSLIRAATPTAQTVRSVPVAVLYPVATQRIRFYAKSGSKLRIEGTSTVHDWQAESSLISGSLDVGPGFPLEPGQRIRPGTLDAHGRCFVMVHSLRSVDKDGRSYSDRMDEDLHRALKADKDPRISFDLAELTLTEPPKGRDQSYICEGKGQLAIAGVTNEITLPLKILPFKDNSLRISGTTTLKMTDFQITPPSMSIAQGQIKIGDDVNLSFDWMLSRRNFGTSADEGR